MTEIIRAEAALLYPPTLGVGERRRVGGRHRDKSKKARNLFDFSSFFCYTIRKES